MDFCRLREHPGVVTWLVVFHLVAFWPLLPGTRCNF
jgi:hypothetical protein